MITGAVAVVALLIGRAALFLQLSAPEAIDFQQCTILSTTSRNPPAQTICNDICGQKTGLFGLSKFSETLAIPNTQLELNSQESFASCSQTIGYGTAQNEFSTDSYSTSCVYCN